MRDIGREGAGDHALMLLSVVGQCPLMIVHTLSQLDLL